jgi:outer membrane protein OmpA-like peptidoglycan-associated protein
MRRAVVLAAAAALSACQSPPKPAAAPETVVVLPGPDGRTGTVVVERGGQRTVLDKPYAASRTGADAAPGAATLSEQEVRNTFGTTLASMPARPASFLLYFVTGTDALTDESRGELGRMLEELKRRPSPDILLIGHTDRVGQVEQNDRLSLQRAERVKADLISQGLPAGRITTAGRGEREPVVPTADGVDEPRNRRVEINVR